MVNGRMVGVPSCGQGKVAEDDKLLVEDDSFAQEIRTMVN